MKRIGLWILLLLFSAGNVRGEAVVPDGYAAIDMRDGLAESRIRQIRQMPDGRIAVATTTTIDIYDGTRFTSYRLLPERACPLPGYHGKRQLTCDVAGRVWLRHEQTLYVVDTRRREVVASVDSLLSVLNLKEQDIVAWPETGIPGEYDGIGKVTAVEHDCYGGLWIGTKEDGILYHNPGRQRQFTTSDGPFVYPRQRNHATERTRKLEAQYAPQATNCMLDDGTDGYACLGTFRGLMIFDRDDRLVATLDEQDGLHTSNIQALIRDLRGDVWATTSNGITRIHHLEHDRFEITNYGRLDGILVRGREFRPGQIHRDSTGGITAGFVGGIVTFMPDSVHAKRYVFHYPRTGTEAGNTPAQPFSPVWIILLSILLTVPVVLWNMRGKRKRFRNPHREPLPQASESTLEKLKQTEERPSDDGRFLQRLQTLVEANIGNGNFSIQALSEQMAMERSGLYRRVQSLTGLSPSDYVRRVRMDVASRLLLESSLTVAEIASRTGFSTTKYFNRVFKETFSLTPAEYRENKGHAG